MNSEIFFHEKVFYKKLECSKQKDAKCYSSQKFLSEKFIYYDELNFYMPERCLASVNVAKY